MPIDPARLRERRKFLRLSQEALGELAGLSQRSISDLERGETVQTDKLYELARACGVTPEWLLGEEEGVSNTNKTKLNLTPGKKRSVEGLVVVEEPENWLNPANLNQMTPVREIDVRGGASYGGGISEESWSEDGSATDKVVAKWGLPPAFVEKELGLEFAFTDIIRVLGDSMDDGTAKGLSSGDRVIIDRQDTDVRQGGIFAVFDGDGVIIKQVELIRGHAPPRIICKSRNTFYDPISLILESPVRVIGRVAGRISRI